MIKKILFLFLIPLLFLPAYLGAETQEPTQTAINFPTAEPPQTLSEAEGLGRDFLNYMPHQIEQGWQQAIVIWTKMYHSSVSFWNRYIKSHLVNFWNKVRRKSKDQIEEKTEILKEELVKEKETAQEALQESAKKTGKSVWQTILEALGR